jgi:NADPH2:quinone reductase
VDQLGKGVCGIEPGQIIAVLPITGAYAQFVCLPQRELVPVPSALDAAEAVSLVLNYITTYDRTTHHCAGRGSLGMPILLF